ncbi:MAG: hemerythrin family protein [Pseudomonadota bacterium]|nr:hemerythrin family protein [Pseudomonadota bacterium]
MKKFFEWRNEWSLGIEIIDRQHRQLAVILNKIVELSFNNGGQSDSEQRSNQLHDQLNILYEKISEHFNDEEDLMLKVNYPGYAEHAHDHLMLRVELKQYISHIEEELDHIDIGTLNSLKTWFVSHIISSDKEFADFLQVHSQDEVTSSHSVDT